MKQLYYEAVHVNSIESLGIHTSEAQGLQQSFLYMKKSEIQEFVKKMGGCCIDPGKPIQLKEPRAWHLYTYCANDPVNLVVIGGVYLTEHYLWSSIQMTIDCIWSET